MAVGRKAESSRVGFGRILSCAACGRILTGQPVRARRRAHVFGVVVRFAAALWICRT